MKPKKKNTIFRRDGFSIFEVVIVLSIFALVLFAVSSFRGNLNILENLVNQKLQSRQDLDQEFQIMITELRSAGPSSLGAYPIETASTSSITFFSDVDKDGVFERVRYYLSSTTIQKGVIEPAGNPLVYATSTEATTTIISNVIISTSTPFFQYYGANYTGSQPVLPLPIDTTQVRIVKISLSVDVNPKLAPVPIYFSNTINIRNLRSN
ncbi:MAG: hypothetical protein AAB495_01395 [Patescibacteria group bacterium]